MNVVQSSIAVSKLDDIEQVVDSSNTFATSDDGGTSFRKEMRDTDFIRGGVTKLLLSLRSQTGFLFRLRRPTRCCHYYWTLCPRAILTLTFLRNT